MENENLNNQESAQLGIGAVMHRLYQEISKEYKVPVERIMLAITDDAKFFQAYSTNEMEVELFYLCDVPVPNGAQRYGAMRSKTPFCALDNFVSL